MQTQPECAESINDVLLRTKSSGLNVAIMSQVNILICRCRRPSEDELDNARLSCNADQLSRFLLPPILLSGSCLLCKCVTNLKSVSE